MVERMRGRGAWTACGARLFSCVWCVAVVSTAGCSAGAGTKQALPKPETAEEAIGEPKCTPEMISSGGSPLVVDWDASKRSDLEVAMKSGVVIASYTCEGGVKLMPDCAVGGEYGFVGVSVKSEKISLSSADDVGANFSVGASLPVNIKAALQRGSSLNLGYMLIGKRTSVRDEVARAELTGRCDGATHFVRRADVGAFAMKSGAKADFDSAISVFNRGVTAASASSMDVDSTDGKPEACEGADPDASSPPKDCRAIIRVTLLPITEAAPKAADPLASDEPECPTGWVRSEGKCSKKAEVKKAYLCSKNDKGECLEQCKAGDDGSCDRWVRANARDEKTAAAEEKRVVPGILQRFIDACRKSDMGAACAVAARFGAEGDKALEEEFQTLGCRSGYYGACTELRRILLDVKSPNVEKFMKIVGSSCSGGQPEACGLVAEEYFRGDHIKKNREKALKFANRACEGGFGPGCLIQASLSVSPGDCAKLNGGDKGKVCEEAQPTDAAKGLLKKSCALDSTLCATVKVLAP